MQIKTYDETDLQKSEFVDDHYNYQFIADVVGDNADLLEETISDNNELYAKLKEVGALGKDDCGDPEACCFYIYFVTKKAGVDFIKKLNAYLTQKRKLLEEARAF